MAPISRKRMDSGYAWVVLASCFVMRTLVEGFWSSLGIFFVKWQEHFDVGASKTAWIGSTFMLIFYLAAPISSALANRFSYRVVAMSTGLMVSICCFAISHATKFWHIYIIMPLIGFGLGLSYQTSCTVFISCFDKHFALANMLNGSAAGTGYLVIPLLVEITISYFGLKGALQIISVIMANICVCGSLFRPMSFEPPQAKRNKLDFKHNGPSMATDNCQENAVTKTNLYDFLKDVMKDFNLSLFCNIRFIFQAIFIGLLWGGIISAIIYLVPYSISVGISDLKSSFLMLAFGICGVIARLSPIGWLVDKKITSVSTLGGVAHLTCGICFMVVPFINTFIPLMVLACVSGLSVGVGGAMLMIVVAYSAGSKDKAPGAVAWLLLQDGIGATACILLTGVLYDTTGSYQLPYIMCGVCTFCIGPIMLADPCLTRWQSRLAERRKQRSTYAEHIFYSSLSDDPNPTRI